MRGASTPRGAAAGRGPECGTADDLCSFERITTQRRGRQTRRTGTKPTRRWSLFGHSRSPESLTTCNDLSRVVEAKGIVCGCTSAGCCTSTFARMDTAKDGLRRRRRQRWRRWESNPRPETVQNGVYVCSLCFEVRIELRPQTGSRQR